MTGTIAMHASGGHPWPGGASVSFEQRDVIAIGSLYAYNDFVKRYLVRLVDGREAFVKIGEQPEADRKWLNGIARALRSELRSRAVDGTLVVPTRDLSFVIYWRAVAAADRMSDVPKKTPKQLDADIAAVLSKPRKKRKPKKTAHEIRKDRLKALQGRMTDALGDDGWLETDIYDLEKWIDVDDEWSDAEWLRAAQKQLEDMSVSPENAGAPPLNVREWNDVFIATYRMNIDDGMSDEDAIDSARQNAHDTVELTGHEHAMTKTDPKLYTRRW